MRVEHLMHSGAAAPIVEAAARMPDVIHEMSDKRLGMTCIVDSLGRLIGIFTDGDLRRLMQASADVLALTAEDVMKRNPRTIRRDMLAVEALKIMETHKITSVVVAADDGRVEGVVHLHDLWRTQMI
jgi:arabinose-5-phosphate isomerase